MPPKLELRELSRVVEGDRLVDGVSLSVATGEVLGVVGPSGAGKSSLLRCVNRLDEPTSGTVLLDGTDYQEIPPRELRRRISYVPQQPGLRDGTVRENVTVGPRLRGEPVDDAEVVRLLDRVGLDGYEDRPADELSGGEAQCVAIARTIIIDPEVLLLDEPTASLDPAAERQVEALLEALVAESDLTAVLVTHDRSQAARLADRVAVFEDGRVVSLGTAGEVLP